MPIRMSLEEYEKRTTGTGPTFREQQRRRVDCPECGVEVAAGSLLMHRLRQHGMGWGDQGPPPPPPGGPNLPGLFPKTSIADPVTSRGVPGRGLESDQPPG